MGTAQIIGTAFGAVAGVVVCIGLIYFIRGRKPNDQTTEVYESPLHDQIEIPEHEKDPHAYRGMTSSDEYNPVERDSVQEDNL